MKYLKNFKLFETGEWSSDVDWQFVKDNPDDDSEESNWIKFLANELEVIIDDLDNPSILEIIDIKGYDLYQGPYAKVKIFGKYYRICGLEDNILIIENFPITNNDEYSKPSFSGDKWKISDLLNDINSVGGIEMYLNINKFNI